MRNFKPVSVFELPEYPELKLNLPPFLQMLDHVYNRGYTYIHSATPGPMGLAALGIARVLKLPISGTYHTAIPQYAAYLTGDENIEELMWRYMLWYYDQMDKVYVPSTDTGEELVSKGLKEEKIRVYPRGVDVERFNPVRRNGFFQRRFGLDRELRLLYVGRVSKEKNLPILVDAFKRLAANHAGVSLVVVGDGPYLNEMQERMQGLPCTFTGYLKGHDLAEAYASSDLFVFPSTTDTFGNVILEGPGFGAAGGGHRRRRPPREHGARPDRSGGARRRRLRPGPGLRTAHRRPEPARPHGPGGPDLHGKALLRRRLRPALADVRGRDPGRRLTGPGVFWGHLFEGLYRWTLRQAKSRKALWVLGLASLAESAVLPIPIEAVSIPLMLANLRRVWLVALVATAGSVAGGALGYVIGHYLYEGLGSWLLQVYGYKGQFNAFQAQFQQMGWWDRAHRRHLPHSLQGGGALPPGWPR